MPPHSRWSRLHSLTCLFASSTLTSVLCLAMINLSSFLFRPESHRAGLTLVVCFRFSGPSISHRNRDFNSGSCIFSTLRYGLTSTGLPPRGADRQVVAKQVRLVLKSPSWITHESTSELFQRYHFEDPIAQLARALEVRRANPSPSVVAFDTPERQQWHSLLPSFFATPSDTQEHATLHPSTSLPSQVRLQEVTGVLSQTFQCPSVMPSDLHHTHCPTYSHVNKSDSNLQDSCVRAEAQGAQTASHTPTVVTQPSVPHSSSYESSSCAMPKMACLPVHSALGGLQNGLPFSITTTLTPAQLLLMLTRSPHAIRCLLLLVL